jgi:hypothetical protein
MTDERETIHTTPGTKPYTRPRLGRLGTVTELTKERAMVGNMDGGANNTRTG